ncbi:MAG: T9SS type A sorting domain-containing protein [Flavipsychrobacter sp.]
MKKVLLSITILISMLSATAQTFSGAGMESWRSLSVGFPSTQVTLPDHWFGTDSLIYTVAPFLTIPTSSLTKQMVKSSSAHSGSFAAEVTSKNQGTTLGVIPGILTNARPGIDIAKFDPNNPISSINYVGGTSISSRIGYVSAWLKYAPQGGDKAQIIITAVLAGQGLGGADSIVGSADTIIASQVSAYTKYEVKINYIDPNVVPDKLLVLFLSSTSVTATVPVDGSKLTVDDVEAGIHSSGIHFPLLNNEVVSCYPNPATEVVNINTTINQPLIWELYNMSGQKVKQVNFTKNTTVNVKELPSGMYFYSITSNDGALVYTGKLSVDK